MNRKKEKTTTRCASADADLVNHIQGLGLKTVGDYRQWCDQNGFSNKLRKRSKQLYEEREFALRASVSRQQQELNLRQRESRRPGDVLAAICSGRVQEADVTRPHFKRLCAIIRGERNRQHGERIDRKALLRLLPHLQRCRA